MEQSFCLIDVIKILNKCDFFDVVARPLRDVSGQVCQVGHWFGEQFSYLGCQVVRAGPSELTRDCSSSASFFSFLFFF